MSAPQTEDFWQWSLTHYAHKGVEPVLLQLQDEFDFNVNITLWCCWCARHYDAAPDLALRHAIDQTANWNANVTAPLRSVRRFLKTHHKGEATDDTALRERIKDAELDAEKEEQARLETLSKSALSPLGATADQHPEHLRNRTRRNLAAYTALIGAGKKNKFTISLLETLIDHLYSQQPANRE